MHAVPEPEPAQWAPPTDLSAPEPEPQLELGGKGGACASDLSAPETEPEPDPELELGG